MSQRRIGGLIALVAMMVIGLGNWTVPWYTMSRGSRSMEVFPLFAKQCREGICEYEALMKGARGNEQELWAASGMGLVGIGALTGLFLLITGILGLVQARTKAMAWVTAVFSFFTLSSVNAFKFTKPPLLAFPEGSGYMVALLGALMALGACIAIIASKDPALQQQPMGFAPQPGMPPPGYGQPGMPPPGYGQPGMPQPGYGQPGMPPQQGFAPQQNFAPQAGDPQQPPAQAAPMAPSQQYAPTQAMEQFQVPGYPPAGGGNPTGQG